MHAIIETGGKQYKVTEGDEIYIEKLSAEEGETVSFRVVAVLTGDGINTESNATVSGKVARHGKGAKLVIFKYKPKKKYRRKQGHRQPYSKVIIDKIEA